eukprot:PhM_4_TR15905/c1_g3_i1/m.32480
MSSASPYYAVSIATATTELHDEPPNDDLFPAGIASRNDNGSQDSLLDAVLRLAENIALEREDVRRYNEQTLAMLERRDREDRRRATQRRLGFVSTHDEELDMCVHDYEVRRSFPLIRFPLDISCGKGKDKMGLNDFIGVYNSTVGSALNIIENLKRDFRSAQHLFHRLQARPDTWLIAREVLVTRQLSRQQAFEVALSENEQDPQVRVMFWAGMLLPETSIYTLNFATLASGLPVSFARWNLSLSNVPFGGVKRQGRDVATQADPAVRNASTCTSTPVQQRPPAQRTYASVVRQQRSYVAASSEQQLKGGGPKPLLIDESSSS